MQRVIHNNRASCPAACWAVSLLSCKCKCRRLMCCGWQSFQLKALCCLLVRQLISHAASSCQNEWYSSCLRLLACLGASSWSTLSSLLCSLYRSLGYYSVSDPDTNVVCPTIVASKDSLPSLAWVRLDPMYFSSRGCKCLPGYTKASTNSANYK